MTNPEAEPASRIHSDEGDASEATFGGCVRGLTGCLVQVVLLSLLLVGGLLWWAPAPVGEESLCEKLLEHREAFRELKDLCLTYCSRVPKEAQFRLNYPKPAIDTANGSYWPDLDTGDWDHLFPRPPEEDLWNLSQPERDKLLAKLTLSDREVSTRLGVPEGVLLRIFLLLREIDPLDFTVLTDGRGKTELRLGFSRNGPFAGDSVLVYSTVPPAPLWDRANEDQPKNSYYVAMPEPGWYYHWID